MAKDSRIAEAGLAAIVLAAGLGTRMRSKRAKVLHEIGGTPMVARVVRALETAGAAPIVAVTGYQAREVEAAVRASAARAQVASAIQAEPRGTGDAARAGLGAIAPGYDGDVLIAYGDMPMLTAATLVEFVATHRTQRRGAVLYQRRPCRRRRLRTRRPRRARSAPGDRRGARRITRGTRRRRDQHRDLHRARGRSARRTRRTQTKKRTA